MEADGGPLGLVVAPAHRHDAKLLARTIDAVVVDRPKPSAARPQHLCLDKGYDNPSGRAALVGTGYTPHLRRIGEEKPDPARARRPPARRWVVERTIAWLNRWRGILVRYAKKSANYLGVVQLACALLWYRRMHRLRVYG